MFHKPVVDDRVNSAISEGLESQQAARARKAKPGPLGLVGRLFAKILPLRARKTEEAVALPAQPGELSQKP